jgi:hypothetical protein
MNNMKVKKIPMRMCSVTRERFPKVELLRIVKTPEEEVKVDLSGKLNGHGAYIKKDLTILEKAKKTKALARALEIEIPESIYEEIESIIKKENN